MMSYKLNLRKDPEDRRDFPFLCSLNPEDLKNDVLLSYTSKVDHSNIMSPVKDQGALGSCVGFAVTAMKEWQEQKEQNDEVAAGKRDTRGGKPYDLSEAWVYWGSKKIDGYPNEEGTSIRYAMKVLNKIGVPTENAWPYSDEFKGEPSSWAKLIARWSLIGSYYRVGSLTELIAALNKGPVVIGIGCYSEIFSVKSNGIVPMPANPRYCYGGHAVCACGYDAGNRLIKFKNSWGKDWGEKGYGYLYYEYINDYMWDAWTCIDLSVTKEMLKGASAIL